LFSILAFMPITNLSEEIVRYLPQASDRNGSSSTPQRFGGDCRGPRALGL
jgi:hypothetical protein